MRSETYMTVSAYQDQHKQSRCQNQNRLRNAEQQVTGLLELVAQQVWKAGDAGCFNHQRNHGEVWLGDPETQMPDLWLQKQQHIEETLSAC